MLKVAVNNRLRASIKWLRYRFGGRGSVAIRIREVAQSAPAIFVPCFNNYTYCNHMLQQLRHWGLNNIVFVDNDSTDLRMREFLNREDVVAIELGENLGPRALIQFEKYYREMPDIFCVTDPDIVFNTEMPSDFMEQLLVVSEQTGYGKVGLALRIDDVDGMHDSPMVVAGTTIGIADWERRFWQNRKDVRSIIDPVYIADIDTTFALYNKKYFKRTDFFRALRVAGRFTARHDPWYKVRLISDREAEEYTRIQKFSTVFGQSTKL